MASVSSSCPACGQGNVFEGWLKMRTRCEHCGAVFLREEGDWIGATVVAYMLGSVFAVGMLLVLFAAGALTSKGSDALVWAIVCGSTVLFVTLVLRPVKAFWVGLLYDWGYVYPDRPDEEPSPR